MYVCILSYDGDIVLHRNMKAAPEPFLKAITPYREGLIVAVECIFTWYWLADLCAQEGIPFVLGHALYMKAIHGGKAKNDKIDYLTKAGDKARQAYANREALTFYNQAIEVRERITPVLDMAQQFPLGPNLPIRLMSEGSPGASFGAQKSCLIPPAQRETK
jgi:hypothetical protein